MTLSVAWKCSFPMDPKKMSEASKYSYIKNKNKERSRNHGKYEYSAAKRVQFSGFAFGYCTRTKCLCFAQNLATSWFTNWIDGHNGYSVVLTYSFLWWFNTVFGAVIFPTVRTCPSAFALLGSIPWTTTTESGCRSLVSSANLSMPIMTASSEHSLTARSFAPICSHQTMRTRSKN